MEHQNHSTENGAPEHLISPITTTTTSSGTPSFRVYKDMGTENFANGRVSYRAQDGSSKNCLDALNDDERYNYGCRCGCSAVFSGLGRDIKAAFSIGQSTFPAILALGNTGTSEIAYNSTTGVSETVTTVSSTHIKPLTSDEAAKVEIKKARVEMAEKLRPFVSDRYIKKAVFGLTDNEIDADHEENPDLLTTEKVKLSERQPPGIGDLVYELSSGQGPYTLVDYVRKTIKLDGGDSHGVFCGIVRTAKGDLIRIPLADLAHHWADRPVAKAKSKWLRTVVMMITSSAIGSAAIIACYYFL